MRPAVAGTRLYWSLERERLRGSSTRASNRPVSHLLANYRAHIHLEVAEPGVASAALDTREPTAGQIEDQHNPYPDEIYHWQADAIVCRHLIGPYRPRTIGCHGRPAEPDIVAYDRSGMNQRNVQQVK